MEKEDFSFEIEFYEGLDQRDGDDARVLELLAQLYTRVGRISDGLSMDLRLSRLRPDDPLVHYNLACSLALVDRQEESVQTLKNAIEMGYSDFDWMHKDKDLDAIRDLPAFKNLIKQFES